MIMLPVNVCLNVSRKVWAKQMLSVVKIGGKL